VQTRRPGVGASPLPEIAAGAARYRKVNGFLAPEQDYSRTVIPPSQTRAIGAAYMAAPSHDPAALPSFHALREETNRQFDHMTGPRSKGGMGMDVTVHDEDPYGHDDWAKVMPELRHDVQENNHIGVLSGRSTGGHPLVSDDDLNRFRAVHDVFGHLASGRGVDRHGEEAAYQAHAAMYSPTARGALALNTRGQNAALHLNNGAFQEQKVALLPRGMDTPRNLSPRQFGEMKGARQQAVEKNRQQGLI
jgi:hypothetical protein